MFERGDNTAALDKALRARRGASGTDPPHRNDSPAEAVTRLQAGQGSGTVGKSDSNYMHNTNRRRCLATAASVRVHFDVVGRAALAALPDLLRRWLPDGKLIGHEWVARNPRRDDRHPGSFKINVRTGYWADFATGDAGRDVISLAAYLSGLSRREAAQRLAQMLGVRHV